MLLSYARSLNPFLHLFFQLAGIVKPNDCKCHLDSNGLYSASLNQDYPSVSQLSHKIKENNVNVIFAVTSEKEALYTTLSNLIEGSVVGQLNEDSSNIVNLVKKNYEV